MTTPLQIRTGLKTNLDTALGQANVQVSGYRLSSPTAPGFEIELAPAGVEYDQSFNRGLDKWTWTVRGFVALAADIGAQVNLDLWLAASGTDSVKAALEADRTLGATVSTLHVTQAVPRTFTVAGNTNESYLGAEWTVEVYATA